MLLVEVHSEEIIIILEGSFCENGEMFHTKSDPIVIPEFSVIEYAFDENQLNTGVQNYYTGNGCSNISIRTSIELAE